MALSAHRSGTLWIEVTNGCNLICGHCYSDSFPGSQTRDRLSSQDYFHVIADGYATGFRRVQFIGGEPMLNKNLPQFIAKASTAGYRHIEVFSNLRSVPEAARSAIVSLDANVATSVYSHDSAVHDGITGVKGSFQASLANLKSLLDHGVTIRAGFIEMDANRGHYDQTAEMLKKLGNLQLGFDGVRSFGRGATSGSEMSDLCGACAGDTACVSHDGRVLPCIMSREWPLGSVLEDSLEQILSSSLAVQRRTEIKNAINGRAEFGCTPDTCSPYLDGCNPNTCDPYLKPPRHIDVA